MLETLPNELLLLVLSQCRTARDLHRLLAASPRCYRAFARRPAPILLRLLRRVVPAPVWADFAAVCRAEALFAAPDSPALGREEDVPAFLDRYFGSGFGGLPLTGGKAQLVRALRLHATISYFVRDYARKAAEEVAFLAEHGVHVAFRPGRAIRAVRHDGPARRSRTTDASMFQTLSPTETARFYRGFLRLELLSRVFRHSSAAREQYDLFVRRLPPWAVEELTCAHQYFLYGVWDALEESVHCTESGENPLRHFGVDLPFTLPSLRSSAWPLFLSGLLRRGVAFLYDVLVAQKGNRVPGRQPDAVKAAAPGELQPGTVAPPFLAAALETARYHAEPIAMPVAAEDDDDGGTGPSWGFCEHIRRARLADRYLPVLQFEGHAAVRATGYVFWDAAKMRSDVMGNAVMGANGMEFGAYHDRYGREHRSLVQTE